MYSSTSPIGTPQEPFHVERLARGNIEYIQHDESGIAVGGWMLIPEGKFTSIRGYLNGASVGTAEKIIRPDLESNFPWISHAVSAGFQIVLQPKGDSLPELNQVDLVGFDGERPVARMSSPYWTGLTETAPIPPEKYLKRSGAIGNEITYLSSGLKIVGDYMGPIERYRVKGTRLLLDWGCGCGRLTRYFLMDSNLAEVHGCDIDEGPVTWCATNLPRGKFRTISPEPPSCYDDGMFHVIIGSSVFTHLVPEMQAAWLAELKRISALGGLLLATTMGESAAAFRFSGSLDALKDAGIYFELTNYSLDGIAPEGYYRDVYQTREYTLREWSKYFEVLEYIENGVGNHQDLVVMRKV